MDRFTVPTLDDTSTQVPEVWVLYLVCVYLAWSETMMRELRYSDAGRSEREMARHLSVIALAFSADFRDGDEFQFERARQRAIGELMMPKEECITFYSFFRRLERNGDQLASWLERPRKEIEVYVRSRTAVHGAYPGTTHRVRVICGELRQLIGLLDPDPFREPRRGRARLPRRIRRASLPGRQW